MLKAVAYNAYITLDNGLTQAFWPSTIVMSFVIFFFGSGLAFYIGAGLVFLAVAGKAFHRVPVLSRRATLTALVGLTLVGVSAAPLPYWVYAILGVATLGWLVTEGLWQKNSKVRLPVMRGIVSLLWLAAVALEGQYLFAPAIFAPGRPDLWIIGDSVAAGLGDRKTETWPKILARSHGIAIHDRSRAGDTVGTALRDVEKEPIGEGVFLLEIGGNDLLGTTTADHFEETLDSLLTAVCRPGRTVVMFELPLPPFRNQYGLVQRRLAALHGVRLIPKRYFVEVLCARNATVDSVHLSQHGHQLMADLVWSFLAPIYDQPQT